MALGISVYGCHGAGNCHFPDLLKVHYKWQFDHPISSLWVNSLEPVSWVERNNPTDGKSFVSHGFHFFAFLLTANTGAQ